MIIDHPLRGALASWPPKWVLSPFSKKIIRALGEDNVRFVGGAVRDSLIGRPVSDIDMATKHVPEVMGVLLEGAGLKVIPTGIQHGTVTVAYKDEIREITTLRVDQETDGRHAVVAYTDDWTEDGARRDFTINALYMAADGSVFDPFDGIADIQARRVRFIGDAAARIQEDGLRILRFYRFSSIYADVINALGQTACRAHAVAVAGLSAERVSNEILKLLTATKPDAALRAMNAAGVMMHVFTQGSDLNSLLAQVVFDRQSRWPTSPLTRLWLLSGAPADTAALAKQFRLSGAEKKRLNALYAARAGMPNVCAESMRRFIYKFGVETAEEAVRLCRDHTAGQLIHQQIAQWQAPTFPVTGKDMIMAGYVPGAHMGEVLQQLEEAWLDSDFSLSSDDLLTMVSAKKN